MPLCAIKSCGISAYQAKEQGIGMHLCPENPIVRNRWRSFCDVEDLPGNFSVCSQHFKPEDFVRTPPNVRDSAVRHLLTSEAVPSIFKLSSAQIDEAEKQVKSKLVAELLKLHEEAAAPKESGKLKTIRNLRTKITHQKQTIMNFKAQLSKKLKQTNDLKRLMQRAIKDKDLQIRNLTSDLEHARKSHSDVIKVAEERVVESVRDGLKKVFTTNQSDLILGLKKNVNWTPKEIDLALSLRYHSMQVYDIVRKEMKIPLPSPQTLKIWESQVHMEEGVLKSFRSEDRKSLPSEESIREPLADSCQSEMVVEYLHSDELDQSYEVWIETTNEIQSDLSEIANAEQTNENADPLAENRNEAESDEKY